MYALPTEKSRVGAVPNVGPRSGVRLQLGTKSVRHRLPQQERHKIRNEANFRPVEPNERGVGHEDD